MYRYILLIILIFCNISALPQYYWLEISDSVPSNLPGGDFTDIHCIGNDTWITLYTPDEVNGVILHSNDGCMNYTIQNLPSVPYSIHMITPDIGFVGCANGDIYFTSNGGELWKKIFGNFDKHIYGISGLSDPLVGYACSKDGWIIKFDTNHIISQVQPFGSLFPIDLYDIDFPTDTSEGWVCGSESTIGYYNNGWDSLTVPYCGTYYGIDFLPGTQLGWSVGGQGTFMTPVIIHAEDGYTWNIQNNPLLDYYLYDVHFVHQQVGWAVGEHVMVTFTGGSSWNEEFIWEPNIWHAIHSAPLYPSYCVGNNKRIIKTIGYASVYENEELILTRVFPNPLSALATFDYVLVKPSNVTIYIFNSQGQLVQRIEQEQSKGPKQTQWNTEGLPAGMYYFRIQAGDKVGGGKMIVSD